MTRARVQVAVLRETEARGPFCTLVMSVIVVKDVVLFVVFAINVEFARVVRLVLLRGRGWGEAVVTVTHLVLIAFSATHEEGCMEVSAAAFMPACRAANTQLHCSSEAGCKSCCCSCGARGPQLAAVMPGAEQSVLSDQEEQEKRLLRGLSSCCCDLCIARAPRHETVDVAFQGLACRHECQHAVQAHEQGAGLCAESCAAAAALPEPGRQPAAGLRCWRGHVQLPAVAHRLAAGAVALGSAAGPPWQRQVRLQAGVWCQGCVTLPSQKTARQPGWVAQAPSAAPGEPLGTREQGCGISIQGCEALHDADRQQLPSSGLRLAASWDCPGAGLPGLRCCSAWPWQQRKSTITSQARLEDITQWGNVTRSAAGV